jgi:hypothetical protein
VTAEYVRVHLELPFANQAVSERLVNLTHVIQQSFQRADKELGLTLNPALPRAKSEPVLTEASPVTRMGSGFSGMSGGSAVRAIKREYFATGLRAGTDSGLESVSPFGSPSTSPGHSPTTERRVNSFGSALHHEGASPGGDGGAESGHSARGGGNIPRPLADTIRLNRPVLLLRCVEQRRRQLEHYSRNDHHDVVLGAAKSAIAAQPASPPWYCAPCGPMLAARAARQLAAVHKAQLQAAWHARSLHRSHT